MKIGYTIINNKTLAYLGGNYHHDQKEVWTSLITNWICRKTNLPQNAYNWIDELVHESLANRINFYGIAKCHPDDEFFTPTGQKLAKERLLTNFYTARDKAMNKFIKIINNIPHVNAAQRLAKYRETIIHNIFMRTQAEELLNNLSKGRKDIDQYRRKQ